MSGGEAEDLVKKIKFWLMCAGFVSGAGFGGAMYLNRYAQAADLKSLQKKHDDLDGQFGRHETEEAGKMGSVESAVKDLHEDVHFIREEIQRIADRVGADHVPPPKH